MKWNKTLLATSMLLSVGAYAQNETFVGKVTDSKGFPVANAQVFLEDKAQGGKEVFTTTTTDEGTFRTGTLAEGRYTITIVADGFFVMNRELKATPKTQEFTFVLNADSEELETLVISGTMKEMSKTDSPVPVEVYTANFFKANPNPSIFDALQNVNGVRPQINCNVCNTGDIHINGLEGPYTMILIDGMPIVSGLSTVYGLSGIPQSLIDRVEVVKGPASTLYGSEAVAGLVNIITKKPEYAPIISVDAFGTSWGEINADLGGKFSVGKKAQSLVGINYFNYSNPIDKNGDNFTDVTLQNRISIFNKWDFERKDNRLFSIAARYVKENRWGGEMQWDEKKHRGGDEVYGESIYTDRWELFGTYQLPIENEDVFFQFSANGHKQDSYYGDTSFDADQRVLFGQLHWFKTIGKHDLLSGITYRYTYFDDNTPATASPTDTNINQPTHTHLPGVFVQDQWKFNTQNTLLLGLRYDYNSLHGSILTPRINYKWNSEDKKNTLRFGFGNGYRVANVFTEDHQALTGAREVVFIDDLKPETSYNFNVNYVRKFMLGETALGLDFSGFYTYFTNKIIADAETDANKIIYDNLHGHAVSKGVSLNMDLYFPSGFKVLAGATLMDVYSVEVEEKHEQLFAEHFTGTWNIGYTFRQLGLTIDYTGNVYGPMKLPLVGDLDPRPEYSPWWSIQNIQLTQKIGSKIEIYGGVKNLLNWTPADNVDFLIARANDPFDKNVQFDANENAVPTADNPYALTFDPGYVYAPNQGIRGFLGFRYTFY